jgi:hypothetical protein
MKKMLDSLIGKKVGFCGVDNNVFCLKPRGQDRVAFEAVEDEADGFRSMLAEVRQVPLTGHIFFRQPIVSVTVERDEELEGYRLVDSSGHVWFRCGTDERDDYYPCSIVDYTPNYKHKSRSQKKSVKSI